MFCLPFNSENHTKTFFNLYPIYDSTWSNPPKSFVNTNHCWVQTVPTTFPAPPKRLPTSLQSLHQHFRPLPELQRPGGLAEQLTAKLPVTSRHGDASGGSKGRAIKRKQRKICQIWIYTVFEMFLRSFWIFKFVFLGGIWFLFKALWWSMSHDWITSFSINIQNIQKAIKANQVSLVGRCKNTFQEH